jgi:hypothetical protein
MTEWDDWLYEKLPDLDLRGKKIAVFCTGKQEGYPDVSCEIHRCMQVCFVTVSHFPPSSFERTSATWPVVSGEMN